MTLSASDAIEFYVIAGATTPFDFDHAVEDSTHVLIYEDGTLLTEGVDYSIAGQGTPPDTLAGITITPVAATVASTWTVVRQTPKDQATSLAASLSTVETGLDYLARRIQDVYSQVLRSARWEVITDAIGPTIEKITADRFWKSDANGNMVDGGSVADIANAQSNAAAAAASASAASTSETNAATSETNAAASAAAASTSETNAATSETNAASSAAAASTSETNAATSETNAASSAAAASTSASNAATSETNAATSETNAATSETNAATSETNAAASEAAAAASYDSFDDRYLGAKASDPTLDNDGDPLVAGALYFNTTSGEMRVYSGATWSTIAGTVTSVAATVPTGMTISGSPITGAGTLAFGYDTGYEGFTTAEAAVIADAVTLSDNQTITGSKIFTTLIDAEGGIKGGSGTGGFNITHEDDTGYTIVSGGNGTGVGANFLLYGSTHATAANDWLLRVGTTAAGRFDYSADTWRFTCPTANVDFLIGSTQVHYEGTQFKIGDNTAAAAGFFNTTNSGELYLSGGNGQANGFNITAWGGAHATLAKDLRGRSDTTDIFYYDDSASTFNFTNVALQQSGDQVLTGGQWGTFIPVGYFVPTTTNGAEAATEELATNDVMVDLLLFDDSTRENACAQFVMPENWDGGTITAQFVWKCGATTGNVIWGLEAVCIGNDDPLDVAFGTAQEVTDGAGSAADDVMISSYTAAITVSAAAAGELMMLKVYRDAADASDTLTGDAELIGIRVKVEINARNED